MSTWPPPPIDRSRPVTCLLLAGGASRRMQTTKAFLAIGQNSLLQYIIDQIKFHMNEIIICCADPTPFTHFNLRMAIDRFPGEGPMVAIEAGLKLSHTQANFVLACDIPAFNWMLWQRLYQAAEHADIVVSQHSDGKYEPLFAFYSQRIIPGLTQMLDQGERQILQVYPLYKTVTLTLTPEEKLWNLNTPEDYQAFLGHH